MYFRGRCPPYICIAAFLLSPCADALDPNKGLTQYTRTVLTQAEGLPQDTIRAIAQTTDGYLWLGTDEGLARFDGYDFAVFNRDRGDLPANSVTALAAAADGSLWIGSSDGLVHYHEGRFSRYTTRNGLPDNVVAALWQDHSGDLWIVSGIALSRFHQGRFTNYHPGKELTLAAVRAVYEDRAHKLWIAGYGGVARLSGDRFVPVIGSAAMGGDIVSSLCEDHLGNLWVGGSKGLLMRSPEGRLRMFGSRDGLPDPFVRALWEDRDGNLWAGTNGGLARLDTSRLPAARFDAAPDRDWVRSVFEDREGNVWVGMNSGLSQLRDDLFTVFGRAEGLPSDEPTAVYQDRAGRIWIGFHDTGLLRFGPGKPASFTTAQGLAANEVFSIREDRAGGLLIATRDGLGRLRAGGFEKRVIEDRLGRRIVFDALGDRAGNVWAAAPSGLYRIAGGEIRNVLPGGALLQDAFVALAEAPDGSIWAGTYGQGLWHVEDGHKRQYTLRDGLSSEQIRALYPDPDGTLWIGTFGGGLDCLREGRLTSYTSRQGLLSDNVAHIEDDGAGSLWLSTTRGVCRVSRSQLRQLDAGAIRILTPVNYGVEDGLRSAQCAPGYPISGGGERTSEGRLWFPTSRGLAVLDPGARRRPSSPPAVHITEVTADGRPAGAVLQPGSSRLQIRYTGIHLSAPERVRYSYKLEGIDHEWVPAGTRRVINYNSLPHGTYRFLVQADLGDGPGSQDSYGFRVLPHVYETRWFRWLCALALAAAVWAAYRLRLRQIRGRFALVLDERARIAREIHDTLAQGFVGISSQLDAVAMTMPENAGQARTFLELARKMARHSLTEARRAVMDLRASALEDQDLRAALASGARQWTAGAAVEVRVEVTGAPRRLPEEIEQHTLRIAQEAVTNVLKHAGAGKILIRLDVQPRVLSLRVEDDGRGFEQRDAFSAAGGHFGLIGMRERAERLGGELKLQSRPGAGTLVEVTIPLA